MEFLVGTHINFLGHRKGAFILSLVVIAIGLVSLGIQGGPKLGIDFEGGILLQVQFEQPIAAESIRATLAEIGLGDAEIQHFGSGREAIIRTRDQGGGI
jgi:preprotein translocase subunit SecF